MLVGFLLPDGHAPADLSMEASALDLPLSLFHFLSCDNQNYLGQLDKWKRMKDFQRQGNLLRAFGLALSIFHPLTEYVSSAHAHTSILWSLCEVHECAVCA